MMRTTVGGTVSLSDPFRQSAGMAWLVMFPEIPSHGKRARGRNILVLSWLQEVTSELPAPCISQKLGVNKHAWAMHGTNIIIVTNGFAQMVSLRLLCQRAERWDGTCQRRVHLINRGGGILRLPLPANANCAECPFFPSESFAFCSRMITGRNQDGGWMSSRVHSALGAVKRDKEIHLIQVSGVYESELRPTPLERSLH